MENTVQEKKDSINALAQIVVDMEQIYTIAQNIEQYCEQYAVFAGSSVIQDMRSVQMQLKETNSLLSNVAEQVGKKVDQVLSGTATFPEYRILTIDRRLIAGETKKAYILAAPNSLNISETYFVPKSMTSPNADNKGIDFKYFPDFSVVVMSKGSKRAGSSKIPVQYLVQMMNIFNGELAKEDGMENLRKKTIQYYSTGKRKELWLYEETPEELHKDPEYGKAMDDLFLADNEDAWDIESLVHMRRFIDPKITAEQMKLCSDFLSEYRFEDFRSIDTCHLLYRSLRYFRHSDSVSARWESGAADRDGSGTVSASGGRRGAFLSGSPQELQSDQ